MDLGASGRTWAVATPHALATEAAAVAFERGGNAVDAALAAATTLAVVYPHMCGVGGDLFALVQHPAGDVVAINASGRAPSPQSPVLPESTRSVGLERRRAGETAGHNANGCQATPRPRPEPP